MKAKITDADIEQRCAIMRAEYLKQAAQAPNDKVRLYFLLSAAIQPEFERWTFIDLGQPMSNGDMVQIMAQQFASLFVQFMCTTDLPEHAWPHCMRDMFNMLPGLVKQQMATKTLVDVPKAN